MLFELATLSSPLLALGDATEGATAWVNDGAAKGRLLGFWRTEIGTLGRLLILRAFENPSDLMEERRRALLSANPFNAGRIATGLEMDSYAPFSFLPPVAAGDRGGIYEVRTYRLKPGTLATTLAGWERAIEPARDYTKHLVIAMHALDGPSRITHIWGFETLAQRADLRARAYGAGVWPPRGGPESIAEATSTIALPQPGSPLR